MHHSHNWADSHNWAETCTPFPQMGPVYVVSDSQWHDVTFPEWHQSQIEKQQQKTGTGDHYTVHAGAGNRFRAAAVASENSSSVYAQRDRNVLYYDHCLFMYLTQFIFFVHGNILNKQTQKKQFADLNIIQNKSKWVSAFSSWLQQARPRCLRESASRLATRHKPTLAIPLIMSDWIIVGKVWEEAETHISDCSS